MKEYLQILKKSILFEGLSTDEMEGVLSCMSAKVKTYKKGELIFRAGESIKSIAIVLEGNIHIIKSDLWGNSSLLTDIKPGEIFGETFAILQNENSGVDAEAIIETKVILLDVEKIMSTCSNNCQFHNGIIRNLVNTLAKRNYMLTRKLEQVTQRGMRNKLLAFFSDQAKEHGSKTFSIPYNRQQMADYLSVDRSAMSNELCKMRNEGLIDFHKNGFKIN